MLEKLKNRQIQIAIVIIVAVVGVGAFAMTRIGGRGGEDNESSILPQNEIYPTVPDTVHVDLTSDSKKQEVTLTISGIPKGTEFIEYELSYEAKGGLPKGVIGTIEPDGESTVDRQITLGTCSSGTCVYDKGVNTIKVTLRFDGEKGTQIFEEEFEI